MNTLRRNNKVNNTQGQRRGRGWWGTGKGGKAYSPTFCKNKNKSNKKYFNKNNGAKKSKKVVNSKLTKVTGKDKRADKGPFIFYGVGGGGGGGGWWNLEECNLKIV